MAQLTHDSRSWCRSSSASSCHLLGPGRSVEPRPQGGSDVPLVDAVAAVEHGARAPAAQAHGFAFRDGRVDLAPARLGSHLILALVHGRRWREADAWSSTHVARSAARAGEAIRMRTRSAHEVPEALRRHNEEQHRDPQEVVSNLGRRIRLILLWRQRDHDPAQWPYLPRMLPGRFSYELLH